MSRYIKFNLPDGDTIIIETEEHQTGRIPASTREAVQVAEVRFEQGIDVARKAAQVLLDKLRSGLVDTPDEIELCFGLKASGEVGNFVVAKCEVEANYSVKMTWKKAEPVRHARLPRLRRRAI